GVSVNALIERVKQYLFSGFARNHTNLLRGEVSVYDIVARGRYEHSTSLRSLILQVWSIRIKSSRLCSVLPEVSVKLAGLFVNHIGQGVNVRRQQLVLFAIFQ